MKNNYFIKTFKRFIKGEQGQVLPLVLILLVLGSTLLAGTLVYASTSLKTSEVTVAHAKELNAADAGVRYALWKLTNEWEIGDGDELSKMSTGDSLPDPYTIIENGKDVTVEIYCVRKVVNRYSYIFKITSTATGSDSNTAITIYTTKISGLWENAISSGTCIELFPGSIVEGPTMPDLACIEDYGCGSSECEVYDTTAWPFAAGDFRTIYSNQAGPAQNVSEWNMNPADTTIGPLYAKPAGGVFSIDNRSGVEDLLSTLGVGYTPPGGTSGTLYVEGDLYIGRNSTNNFIFNLNRNTIYVTGEIKIDPSCKIEGSGIIIAEGHIKYWPTTSTASPDDFVFLMSLFDPDAGPPPHPYSESIDLHPTGNFYGSVAGLLDVFLYPGNTAVLTDVPEEGLNFPMDTGGLAAIWAIRTWQINRNTGSASTDLTITTTFLSDGEENVNYYPSTPVKLNATNGTPPYTWLVIAGTLPPGTPAFTLDSATGVISGTPTTEGTYDFTVQVSDNEGNTAEKPLSITIYPPPVIDTSILLDGKGGVAYSQALAVSGGKSPYKWTIFSGNLPTGLTLNISTGVISGIPKAGGIFNFNVEVTDDLGGSDQQDYIVNVVIDPLTITTPSPLPPGTKNSPYGPVTLTASGGVGPPYVWSWSGNPPNLSLSPDGVISGTPKQADKNGSPWTITITVSDGTYTVSKTFTLVIN